MSKTLKYEQTFDVRICPWCRETIMKGEPTLQEGDGVILHFGCMMESGDDDIFGVD